MSEGVGTEFVLSDSRATVERMWLVSWDVRRRSERAYMSRRRKYLGLPWELRRSPSERMSYCRSSCTAYSFGSGASW